MSKQKNMKNQKQKRNTRKSSKVLITVAIIVLLIPLLLLGYIYFGAKENSGKPVTGSRFENSLDPAITQEQMDKMKKALNFDGVEKVEVNLTSATLRITMDAADDIDQDTLENLLNAAYDKVNDILPVKTYFTNKDKTKMYDLDIHAYNFIPDDSHKEDDQIYLELVKNAANKKKVVDNITTPKNEKEAKELLKQQEEANKK